MTSPWPATAAHRPRESTSRCTRAASSLCRCAASRPPPRGERRRRGETERSQCERARARACLLTAGVQGRCAAGASSCIGTLPPSHWSRTTRAAGAGARAAALALALALTLARCARRGCRLGSRARSGARGCRGSSTSPPSSAHLRGARAARRRRGAGARASLGRAGLRAPLGRREPATGAGSSRSAGGARTCAQPVCHPQNFWAGHCVIPAHSPIDRAVHAVGTVACLL